MTHHHRATIAILSVAAALFACDAALGQTKAATTNAVVPAAIAPTAPPALDLGDCPDAASGFEVGKTYACSCPATALPDVSLGAVPIYGASIYADESNICMAALHAGVLKPSAAANLLVQMVASPPVFKGTTQNGVKSQVLAQAANAAFQFVPAK